MISEIGLSCRLSGTRAPPGAELLAAGFLISQSAAPDFSKLFDIHVMCGTGGRERTQKEYAGLMEASGGRFTRAWHADFGPLGVAGAARAELRANGVRTV